MSGAEELMGQRCGADGGKDVELMGAKTWSCWDKDVERLAESLLSS